MTDDQKEAYHDMVRSHASEAGLINASEKQSGMSILMDMRKLANHPLLMRSYYSDETVMKIAKMLSTNPMYKKNPHAPYIFEELAIMSDFQIQQTLEKFVSKSFLIWLFV